MTNIFYAIILKQIGVDPTRLFFSLYILTILAAKFKGFLTHGKIHLQCTLYSKEILINLHLQINKQKFGRIRS